MKQGRALQLLSGLFASALLSRFMQKKNRMKNDNGSGSCLQQLEPRVVT
jgi:hypothetical protein